MPEIIVFLIGLAAAIRGADWIGKSSIAVAKKFGISHVVIGATLVTIATTLPELTIATIAGPINKEPQLALGTVIGSPIANLGLILGALFLVSRNRPSFGYYSRSILIFTVISILLLIISLNTNFGGFLSGLLICLGTLYLSLEFVIGKRETLVDQIKTRFEALVSLFDFAENKREVFEFVFGALLLAFGSKFLVDSSLVLTSNFHINELVLSLVFIALGTSLPELFTTINSFIYKREGISVGNLVGASVVDATVGVGLATLFSPISIPRPVNYLIFIPLVVIGFLAIFVLWKKASVRFVGLALIASALLTFALLILREIKL